MRPILVFFGGVELIGSGLVRSATWCAYFLERVARCGAFFRQRPGPCMRRIFGQINTFMPFWHLFDGICGGSH